MESPIVFVIKVLVGPKDLRRRTIEIAAYDEFKWPQFCQSLPPEVDVANVKWKDPDGDWISIKNDADLSEALSQMATDTNRKAVLRLFNDDEANRLVQTAVQSVEKSPKRKSEASGSSEKSEGAKKRKASESNTSSAESEHSDSESEEEEEKADKQPGAAAALGSARINALPDTVLALIFQNLPSYERLRVSEVCKRWRSVSQDPWREVTHLELVSIPSKSIGAIVRKCPNLTSLFCKGQELILDDLRKITLSSFKSMALHGCELTHETFTDDMPLFRSENGQAMEELVLHEHKGDFVSLRSERLLCVSLKRLQLSGICMRNGGLYLDRMGELPNLESLLLHVSDYGGDDFYAEESEQITFGSLCLLTNLRELIFPATNPRSFDAGRLVFAVMEIMPKLEILFLPKEVSAAEVFLPLLILKHPALRILVIPGNLSSHQLTIPVPFRSRFPKGFTAKRFPKLHVFVGKQAAAMLRFNESPASWLKVHPIDAPFPEYLEREEVKEIFGDSWIAKQIREEAKRDVEFWNYNQGNVL